MKSSIPVDYSKIRVKLLTPEGHMKHEEECNVQNGYYMIPIYNKGQYSLKVSAPEGWFFDPEIIDFKLDGLNDPCTKNEDINFVLSAFSIEGVVEGGSGSAGLPLTLSHNGKIIDSTITTEGGKYRFKAPPGKYEVATGGSTSACIARGSASVEVTNGPVKVTPNLKISGYHLTVTVHNNGGALSGVPLTMYADSDQNLPGCGASTSSHGKFACNVGKTSSSGSLEIPCAPIGKYQMKAEWKQGDTEFQFTPSVAAVEINAKTEVSFRVSGFSARGRVTVGSEGMSAVAVLVDGKQVAITDNKGYYTLTGLQEGPLEITASAAKTKFSVVKTNLKLASIKIADVTVESFEVCGSVEQQRGSSSIESLVLKRKDNGDSFTIRPTTDGSFCKMVTPAKYTVSPAEAKSSLTPRGLDVDVSHGPVIGLRFTHFKTDVEARVTCIGNCGSMSISLIMGNSVVQTEEGADVKFKDVGPGQYTVRLSDGERGCWEKSAISLMVERVSPQPVHFVQSGFTTKIGLSHPAKLRWFNVDKRQLRGMVDASSGQTAICVPVQGRYTVEIESCRNFEPASLELNVPSVVVHESRAVDALIAGKIVSKEKVAFAVKVRSAAGEREVPVSEDGVFSFQEPLSSTGDVILVPHSANHLFEPNSHSLRFHGECVPEAVQFEAAKGIFVDGSINPPVEGVAIVATHNKDTNVRFETVTDKSGKFQVGPVRRAEDLSIAASLDGYSFSAQPGSIGRINSVKLSKLTVTVSDLATDEHLDGVLLSLVGDKGYRSNNIMDATGTINFVGLAPGDYFLRPILQEYKFAQPTTNIKVKEGEHEHAELKGKRVAYSAWGKVREMSGSALPNLVIEALSQQCDQHQSEATTSTDGEFRIRGLRPVCTYIISIKATIDGSAAPHCFPSQFEVKMDDSEVRNLEMVAAPSDHSTDVAVELDLDPSLVPSLTSYRVLVIRKDSGDVIVQSSIQYPVTVFYYTVPRDGSEYTVRVEPDKQPAAFHAKSIHFTADTPVRVVRLPLTSSRRGSDVKVSMTSYLALPFFGLLFLILFNQDKALEVVSSVVQQVAAARANSASGDRRKRKNN